MPDKMYRLRILVGKKYKMTEFETFSELESAVNQHVENYKKDNNLTDDSNDPTFMEIKKQAEDTINPVKDYLKCETCSDSDHEGQFCRCEDRNMRIAREMRFRNKSPWQEKNECSK